MRIAVEGCCHGDLDKIYSTIEYIDRLDPSAPKIDLLICCGDFECIRNEYDLQCVNVPNKYLSYKDFYKYYSGQKKAPVPTLFIGGNHEASNHLWELYYGGYVAPNIYYLGHSGVVRFGSLRIAGISGIYKHYDFNREYFEKLPYIDSWKKSVYHTRAFEVFKLYQLQQFASDLDPIAVDIFISHDWPTNITNFGNKKQLLKEKPFFQEDIDKGELGSPASEKLLFTLKPKFWFSGHMHCKFAAIVPHDAKGTVCTKFLALDKCLPKHDFLQIIDIIDQSGTSVDTQLKCFEYDVDWLSIIRATNEYLISPHRTFKNHKIRQKAQSFLNNPYQLLDKKVLMDNKEWILGHVQSFCIPPTNFIAHAPAYNPTGSKFPAINYDYKETKNPQTAQFLAMLQLEDYIARSHDSSNQVINDLLTKNEEEIEI